MSEQDLDDCRAGVHCYHNTPGTISHQRCCWCGTGDDCGNEAYDEHGPEAPLVAGTKPERERKTGGIACAPLEVIVDRLFDAEGSKDDVASRLMAEAAWRLKHVAEIAADFEDRAQREPAPIADALRWAVARLRDMGLTFEAGMPESSKPIVRSAVIEGPGITDLGRGIPAIGVQSLADKPDPATCPHTTSLDSLPPICGLCGAIDPWSGTGGANNDR